MLILKITFHCSWIWCQEKEEKHFAAVGPSILLSNTAEDGPLMGHPHSSNAFSNTFSNTIIERNEDERGLKFEKKGDEIIIHIPDWEDSTPLAGDFVVQGPRVKWLKKCADFVESPFVKSTLDLIYDVGTVTGIVLWGQNHPVVSQVGVYVCVAAHVPFAALPRIVSNINRMINPSSQQSPPAASESIIQGTIKKILGGIKIFRQNDQGIQEKEPLPVKVCYKQE